MKSDDLVPFLTAQAPNDLGFRQGMLLDWDPSTESNTVQIAGQEFTDLDVLAVGSITMAAGDLIGVLRYKSTYLILGRIAPAGSGALQTRSASVGANALTASTTYVDLAGGPVLSDVYIGNSRQCLVLICAALGVPSNEQGFINFDVSGASTIAPNLLNAATAGVTGGAGINITATAMTFLGPDDGLNEGLNTFTMKYRTAFGVTTPTSTQFQNRRIIVMPY